MTSKSNYDSFYFLLFIVTETRVYVLNKCLCLLQLFLPHASFSQHFIIIEFNDLELIVYSNTIILN